MQTLFQGLLPAQDVIYNVKISISAFKIISNVEFSFPFSFLYTTLNFSNEFSPFHTIVNLLKSWLYLPNIRSCTIEAEIFFSFTSTSSERALAIFYFQHMFVESKVQPQICQYIITPLNKSQE